MKIIVLATAILFASVGIGIGSNTDSQADVAVWQEFVNLLKTRPFPSERVRPYREELRKSVLGFLELMREQADWEEWTVEPAAFRVGDQLHFLLPLTFGEHTVDYSFSFLVEGDEWFFQHFEAIALRMDQLGPVPVSEFPDLPDDTKAWMRAEIAVSRDVWLYNALAAEKDRDVALDWFRDGAGYALAARAWVPFVSPERAFVLYLCWEQANLRGNILTLERLEDEEAVVRFIPMYFLLYKNTGHLKQQISFEDYRRLFEFRWRDRATNAGWKIDFSYEGDECVLHLHRERKVDENAPRAPAQSTPQDELPDDYIPFTLKQLDDKLVGTSEYLKGFEISMDVHRELLEHGLSIEAIFSLVRGKNVTGTLTYPNGKTTKIEYEIVHHRETEDIYMKSSLGYFLWEYMSVQDGELSFAIYWWYCPPATKMDLEIIEMTEKLLADPSHWHKEDDRECADDLENNTWSLFCALKHSSIEKAGEYNHHNTAMQTVRFVIDEIIPDHGFAHTLMDYNNAPSTRHEDILRILELSKKRIKQELLKSPASP
ncbi:MAG: hypothetical protein JSV33_03095 [bacterium]|nr:MAG: hypothetical protein JSV33_03095 [bacterium]